MPSHTSSRCTLRVECFSIIKFLLHFVSFRSSYCNQQLLLVIATITMPSTPYRRSSTDPTARSNNNNDDSKSKRPSLLVDFSQQKAVIAPTGACISLRDMASMNAKRSRCASAGTSTSTSASSGSGASTTSAITLGSQRTTLSRHKSEPHVALRRNRERLLKILDQATSELPTCPTSCTTDLQGADSTATATATSTETANAKEEITFCVKRTSDASASKHCTDSSDTDHTMSSSDASRSSGGNSSCSGGAPVQESFRRRCGQTGTGTAKATGRARSYHSLLDTSIHSTFLPAGSRHGISSSSHNVKVRSQQSFKSVQNLVGHEGTLLNRSSLAGSFPHKMEDTNPEDSAMDISLVTTAVSQRKSKSCRDLSKALQEEESDIPQEISTGSRPDRRTILRRQRSTPMLLLPRQRSLKDLLASKEKANTTRPILVKHGSFSTKQSEFAALEALMGKTRPVAVAYNNRRDKLRRTKSCDESIFPLVPKKVVDIGERRPVGLAAHSHHESPLKSHSMGRSRMILDAQRRRKLPLQRSMSSVHSRSQSMRTLVADAESKPEPTTFSPKATARIDRRGLMLRQGSFVAGSRMRTLRG
jgi:hypothetical protein